jgi:hypothetical protein
VGAEPIGVRALLRSARRANQRARAADSCGDAPAVQDLGLGVCVKAAIATVPAVVYCLFYCPLCPFVGWAAISNTRKYLKCGETRRQDLFSKICNSIISHRHNYWRVDCMQLAAFSRCADCLPYHDRRRSLEINFSRRNMQRLYK